MAPQSPRANTEEYYTSSAAEVNGLAAPGRGWPTRVGAPSPTSDALGALPRGYSRVSMPFLDCSCCPRGKRPLRTVSSSIFRCSKGRRCTNFSTGVLKLPSIGSSRHRSRHPPHVHQPSRKLLASYERSGLRYSRRSEPMITPVPGVV